MHPTLDRQSRAADAPPPGLIAVTINPGEPFRADTLTGTAIARIDTDPGSSAWRERLLLHVTGTILRGTPSVPHGMNRVFTLYFTLKLRWFQTHEGIKAQVIGGAMEMAVVEGVSRFGFDAAADHGGRTPVPLLSTGIVTMQSDALLLALPPAGTRTSLSAKADRTPAGADIITIPDGGAQCLGDIAFPAAGLRSFNGGRLLIATGGTFAISFAAPGNGGIMTVLGAIASR